MEIKSAVTSAATKSKVYIPSLTSRILLSNARRAALSTITEPHFAKK